MLLGNPFAHPTVMLRRATLAAHRLRYHESCQTAQDYDRWSRLLPLTRAANLEAPLLQYRLRPGISRTRKSDQLTNHDRIALASIRRLVPDFTIAAPEGTQPRGRYGGHSVREADMIPAHPLWRRRYNDLLDAFTAAHCNEPGIEQWRAQRVPHPIAAA